MRQSSSGRRIKPPAVFFDQVHEALDGFLLGDVELHGGLADVEIDLAGGSADVAEVGIGHLAGAIHNAAHDGDAHAFEVAGGFADLLGGVLQIEERAPTARAGDVVGLEDADAGGLQDVVADAQRLAGGGLALDDDGIADAIAEQGADVRGGAEEVVEEVFAASGVEGVFQQDGVPLIQLRCEQAIGVDGMQRGAIGDGDKLGLGRGIHGLHGSIVAGIERDDGAVFDDELGFVIAELVQLVRHGIPLRPRGEDRHGGSLPAVDTIHDKPLRGAAAVAEGIVADRRWLIDH